jgi:UDP-glucose 4-epimerase
MSQLKRILMTGGRGSLAPLIAGHLQTPAHDLVVYSRQAGPGLHPLADLTDPAKLAGPGLLLHLAWSTLPATSEQNRGSVQLNDLPYLEKLLHALAALPAGRRPHLVFFSSGGTVYGNAPGRPNVETDPCRPIGCHGRGKRAAEELIEDRAASSGLPYTILRISNPYGYPVPKSRVQGLIPHALRCAIEAQPLTLWGDGTARKDFLHYTDFLSALDHVIARPLAGTYNLGSGESHSVREVITLAETHTGRPVPLQSIPAPAWDVHDSWLNVSRFRQATGWRPQVTLSEGIRRAAAARAILS